MFIVWNKHNYYYLVIWFWHTFGSFIKEQNIILDIYLCFIHFFFLLLLIPFLNTLLCKMRTIQLINQPPSIKSSLMTRFHFMLIKLCRLFTGTFCNNLAQLLLRRSCVLENGVQEDQPLFLIWINSKYITHVLQFQ